MTLAPPITMIQSRHERPRKAENRTNQSYLLRDAPLICAYGRRWRHATLCAMKYPLFAMVAVATLTAALAAQTANHEGDFLTRIRRLTVEGRRAGERLLVARRQAARLSERARTGQSVLSDLCARPDDAATSQRISPGHRQDDVLVLPAGDAMKS